MLFVGSRTQTVKQQELDNDESRKVKPLGLHEDTKPEGNQDHHATQRHWHPKQNWLVTFPPYLPFSGDDVD